MIYLDYNATTPCDPTVVSAMLPYFSDKFGNAASRTHSYGWTADEAVTLARVQVAQLIHASPEEIIFTSGATEACNLAIKGIYERYQKKGRNHIITATSEHNAVLDSCRHLEQRGASVTYLEVDSDGLIDLTELTDAITTDTILIAIMAANNETGVLQPIQSVGAIAKQHKVAFFTDATQAIGKIPVNVEEDNIDLLALSAHKIYGPKGAGALYVRRRHPRITLTAQMDGGHQERGMRSGTLNVPGIVGLGTACALLQENGKSEQRRLQSYRDALERELKETAVVVNSADAPRLPNVSNLSFRGVKATRLLQLLHRQIAFSLGSACTSAVQGPSHVLTAMGLPPERVDESFRLSIGRFTTELEMKETRRLLLQAYEHLRLTE